MKSDRKLVEKGLGFGVTSAVITTLGMIVGLDSATHSFGAIAGGILAIAVADGFSDALGFHVSEESQKKMQQKNLWIAAATVFLAKFLLALTFLVPFLFVELTQAVYASIAWGMLLLIGYNYHLAKTRKVSPFKVISEHVLIAIIVIIITHYIGHVVQFLS